MSSESAIELRDVSKAYQVYAEPKDRLQQAILPRLRRLARPISQTFGIEIAERNYFKSFSALQSLSFHVARGETLGVIGQNGSGKSTLLKLICGTLEPTTGEVITNGRIGALLELGSGFNPEYTGRENVLLNASVLGLSPDQIEERMDDILAFADIGDFVEQPIKTYSSGMAMRLAFAVIAHVDADILVIDEALAVGDVYFQQKCMRWLRQFQQRGTVLFCGHDTGAVLTLCQRAIWLDSGILKMIGNSKDVAEAYLAYMTAKAAGLPEELVKLNFGDESGRSNDLTSTNSDVAVGAVEPNSREPQSERKGTEAESLTLLPPPPEQAGPAVFNISHLSSEHGTGLIQISQASFTRADGKPLALIRGGEQVSVCVSAQSSADLTGIFFGFHVKDRFGSAILGDNTCLKYLREPIDCKAGDCLYAQFTFPLPYLITARYSLTVAVATGTIDNHVVHHWLHDSIAFDVISPFRNGVLIALPSMVMDVKRLRSATNEDSVP
jgi:lipopolysaccharide transport system ATP-binding protein